MLIQSYKCAQSSNSGLQDVNKTLTGIEQQLCRPSHLRLVDISAKRNRTVPILMTEDVVKAQIARCRRGRTSVSMQTTCTYSPGLQVVTAWTDGSDCVSRVVAGKPLERPHLVLSTYLQKYIATVSQLLDMRKNEFDLLCRQMDHSARVHKDHYCLPTHAILAKISKLFRSAVSVEAWLSLFAGSCS